MGVRCTNAKALQIFLEKAAALLKDNCRKALSKLGDECVAKIRNRSAKESWIDHTGNLRSSIGFAVYDNGAVFIRSAFPVVLSGSLGAAKGNKLVTELAQEYSKAYALVVLAAMEYASDVEAIESKDVLESTKLWAHSVVQKRLQNAIDAALEQINKWVI